jgi:hypothetical protein
MQCDQNVSDLQKMLKHKSPQKKFSAKFFLPKIIEDYVDKKVLKCSPHQGEKIGRIFTLWGRVYFWQFFEN